MEKVAPGLRVPEQGPGPCSTVCLPSQGLGSQGWICSMTVPAYPTQGQNASKCLSFSAKNRCLTCFPSQAQLHYLTLAYQCLTQKQCGSSKKRRPPFCVFWDVNQLQKQVRILPCSWETARTLPDACASWSSLGNFLLDFFCHTVSSSNETLSKKKSEFLISHKK